MLKDILQIYDDRNPSSFIHSSPISIPLIFTRGLKKLFVTCYATQQDYTQNIATFTFFRPTNSQRLKINISTGLEHTDSMHITTTAANPKNIFTYLPTLFFQTNLGLSELSSTYLPEEIQCSVYWSFPRYPHTTRSSRQGLASAHSKAGSWDSEWCSDHLHHLTVQSSIQTPQTFRPASSQRQCLQDPGQCASYSGSAWYSCSW